jgi:hypothetical protein
VNVLPRPGSLSTSTAPPRSLTMECTRESPSPVPAPTSLVVKNGSKMRSSTSGAIPIPESRTSRRTYSPGASPGDHDVIDVAAHWVARRCGVLRELAIPENRTDDVVEVVGNGSGQRCDRLSIAPVMGQRGESRWS